MTQWQWNLEIFHVRRNKIKDIRVKSFYGTLKHLGEPLRDEPSCKIFQLLGYSRSGGKNTSEKCRTPMQDHSRDAFKVREIMHGGMKQAIRRSWVTPSIDASLGSDRSPYEGRLQRGLANSQEPAIFAGEINSRASVPSFSAVSDTKTKTVAFRFPPSFASFSISIRFNWMRSHLCHFFLLLTSFRLP